MKNRSVGTSWFYESALERNNTPVQHTTSSFGSYRQDGCKSIDEHFEELYRNYKENTGIDIRKDIGPMLSDKAFMEDYKMALMEPVINGFRDMSPNDPHIESIIENVNTYWDTKLRSYTESASLAGFLPIATLEFPVLVKQFFQSILKDIIEVEAVKTPNISRHIVTRYLVDNQTGKEYEYPKCMYNGEWQQIWNASKGLPIYHRVDLPQHSYNLIAHLPNQAELGDNPKLSFDLMIPQVILQIGADATDPENFTPPVDIPGNGIRIEFSTGGTLLNGNLDFTTREGYKVNCTVSGQVHYKEGLVDISVDRTTADYAAGEANVVAVIFKGHVSNEANLRSVSVREKRDIIRYTIEDGARWNMPFSIEEIEDAAALLDMNYYNRMVDEIVRTQEMIEAQSVIKFLQDEFRKFNGVQTDIYKLESTASTFEVDLQPPVGFAGDPFKYISTAIQFRLKSIIHQITENVKLDNLSFIIVGNPMATQTITEFVDWKSEQGSTIGGITVNNSYGFATNMGASVRVVASNIYDAYTKDEIPQYDTDGVTVKKQQKELVLHIYVYPTTPDHISFRHLKYTSHLLTSQSQTAYNSPIAARGGAYNIVTAMSRYKTISVQGIQAKLILLNSDRVYGAPPALNRITGAPWEDLINVTTPSSDEVTDAPIGG